MRFPTIRRSHLWLGLAVAGLVVATLSFAQTPSAPSPPATPPSDTQEGKDIGGFHVTQSVEFGGRINETTGSTAMAAINSLAAAGAQEIELWAIARVEKAEPAQEGVA